MRIPRLNWVFNCDDEMQCGVNTQVRLSRYDP